MILGGGQGFLSYGDDRPPTAQIFISALHAKNSSARQGLQSMTATPMPTLWLLGRVPEILAVCVFCEAWSHDNLRAHLCNGNTDIAIHTCTRVRAATIRKACRYLPSDGLNSQGSLTPR